MNIELDPAIAAASLRELGWTVTPPASKPEPPKETEVEALARLFNSLPPACRGPWSDATALGEKNDTVTVSGIGWYRNRAFRAILVGLCMEYLESKAADLRPAAYKCEYGKWKVSGRMRSSIRDIIAANPDLASCLVAACLKIAEGGGK